MDAEDGTYISAASGLRMRLPDFFVVGHPKSGTTALYQMLRAHPGVFLSLKELGYYASDIPWRLRSPTLGLPVTTLDDYAAHFLSAPPTALVGDVSPDYLVSRVAARAIACDAPGARIVAVFREPAAFLRSLHLQVLRTRQEDERDLLTALRRRRPSRLAHPIPYHEFVKYTDQLRRFHEHFPRERVKVAIYEDFRADNNSTFSAFLDFLGLEASCVLTGEVTANKTVTARHPRLEDALYAVANGSGPIAAVTKAVIKAVVPRPVRRSLASAATRGLSYGPPAALDEEVAAVVRQMFKPEVERLADYTQRDLVKVWGYEQV